MLAGQTTSTLWENNQKGVSAGVLTALQQSSDRLNKRNKRCSGFCPPLRCNTFYVSPIGKCQITPSISSVDLGDGRAKRALCCGHLPRPGGGSQATVHQKPRKLAIFPHFAAPSPQRNERVVEWCWVC